jgi:Cu2+-exporting ATPase
MSYPGVAATPSDAWPAAPTPHDAALLRLLDDPQEWQAFSQPSRRVTGCWESSVQIEGMHCAACASTVEQALKGVPGVLDAQVSAASRRATVVWRALDVLPSTWMQAVQASGYRAVPANDTQASLRRRSETRRALWRWLVAGLCMMQVMMYAYPAYVAQPGDLSAQSEQLLRWASWVLTLPVMLFCGGPFFSSAWRELRHGRVGMDLPVALGMVITFAVSSAGTFEPHGIFGREVYFDSLTMFVFFLLTGRWLELRLRERTAGALEALMNRLPDSVERRLADGRFERVAARRLRVDDVLRVRPGEAFAADGVLLQGDTLVDEALLTGESRPLPRGAGSTVVAGSHNLSATVLVRAASVGDGTRFAQIVALMRQAAVSKPALAQLADRLAKPFLLAVLLAALAACLWWWPRDPAHALMVAVAVLVVTCPCALSLATPAAMLASAAALARQGVLVRNLRALEALARVETVIFDKTGTLTRDAMVLTGVTLREGADMGQVLAQAGALAEQSLHPVARALGADVRVRDAAARSPWRCVDAKEVAGKGVWGRLVQGAVGQGPSTTLQLGSAAFCGVPVRQPTAQGLRSHLSDAQGWLATFEFSEDLRPQAAELLGALKEQGVSVRILSGDDPLAVARVAQQLGVRDALGGCTPQDKLARLQALQAAGHPVAMVGDGLNDGPVLAGAQVSFSFGHAVPLAQARADFVLLGEHLLGVAQALVLARRTLRVVRQNLFWALFYNLACIPLAVLGWLPAWAAGLGMAASSLLVVGNALRLAGPLPLLPLAPTAPPASSRSEETA